MSKPTLEIALLALTSEPSGLDFPEKKVIWPETNSGEAPTWGDLENKLTELQAEYDAQEYARNRQQNYPNEHDLLIALWEKVVEGRSESVDALEVKRQEVKTAHPKPE